jgi:hypothetical protein
MSRRGGWGQTQNLRPDSEYAVPDSELVGWFRFGFQGFAFLKGIRFQGFEIPSGISRIRYQGFVRLDFFLDLTHRRHPQCWPGAGRAGILTARLRRDGAHRLRLSRPRRPATRDAPDTPRNRPRLPARQSESVAHSGGHKWRPGFSEILVFRQFSRNRGMGGGSPTLSASLAEAVYSLPELVGHSAQWQQRLHN